jgi:ATP-dependent DNA helicase RecQ
MRKGTRNNSQEARDRARKLRAEMSVSEKILWMFLRGDKTGFRFRTQHAVGPYVLDFYCPEAGLCVEVDGEQHDGRAREDEARDVWLEARGIITMRIPSADV